MPTGHSDMREARLENWRPPGVASDAAWGELDAWWLAASRGASTPNWDFAARVTVEGTPGLILVEAKANVRELSAGGAKTAPTTSEGSIANDAQIRAALLQASIGLARYAPSAALSADHGYQLSNRIAFAWKLASMGIPTVLLYLGFTGDRDIADVSEPPRDAAHWQKLVEGKSDAKPSDWRVAKSIFVADDDKVAERYGRSPEGPYHFYFKQLIRKLIGFGGRGNLFKLDQNQPDSEITPDYVTKKLVIAGTVNSVVDQLLAFRETTGDFGTLLYACHDWMDPTLGRRSMQLMAEQVMPKLNSAL